MSLVAGDGKKLRSTKNSMVNIRAANKATVKLELKSKSVQLFSCTSSCYFFYFSLFQVIGIRLVTLLLLVCGVRCAVCVLRWAQPRMDRRLSGRLFLSLQFHMIIWMTGYFERDYDSTNMFPYVIELRVKSVECVSNGYAIISQTLIRHFISTETVIDV